MDNFAQFGAFFKETRQKSGLTLRQFCQQYGLDPGNISRIERGVAPPPNSNKLLEKYAGILGIRKDTAEWYEFFDLSAACSGKLPPDMMTDKQLVEKLPMVFRTLRGQKLDSDRLKQLAELIRKA